MTYTTPELHLIGAAQNLVLEVCDNPAFSVGRDNDIGADLYDVASLW